MKCWRRYTIFISMPMPRTLRNESVCVSRICGNLRSLFRHGGHCYDTSRRSASATCLAAHDDVHQHDDYHSIRQSTRRGGSLKQRLAVFNEFRLAATIGSICLWSHRPSTTKETLQGKCISTTYLKPMGMHKRLL